MKELHGNGSVAANPVGKTQYAHADHQPSKRRKTDSDAILHEPKVALHGPSDGIERAEDADVGIMQLETAEVVTDMGVDYAQETAVNALVQKLTSVLTGLPKKEVDGAMLKKFFADLDFKPNHAFTFHPPASVEVVGSYAARCACRLSSFVDIAVEMPRECFDSKDQLNHRYHAKRALYLLHIRKSLSRLPGVSAVHWAPGPGSDPRSPYLVLELENGVSPAGLKIRVLPVLPLDAFPPGKLGPARNNLRSAQSSSGDPVPTPQYNASVLRDMLTRQHAKTLQQVAQAVPHFRHAVVLLKTWATQQQVSDGADGVSGFFLTMMLVYLLEKGQATPGMTAIHLFRTTVLALSKVKSLKSGIALQPSIRLPSSSAQPPAVKAWRASSQGVVLVDPSGWLNIAAGISAAALQQAAAAAARTAAAVPSGGPEAIDSAFFARRSLSSLYDVWYKVEVPSSQQGGQGQLTADVPPWREIETKIKEVVTTGLGTRATLVRVIGRQVADMPFDKGAAGPAAPHVLVGVRLDATSALRGVDMGPPADSGAPAEKFRKFWGDKSELRRFLDGSICEAVVWEAGPAGRHTIVDQAVAHCVGRHLPPGTTVTGSAGLLDEALVRLDSDPDEDLASERACQAAFERLGKKLRSVDSVALRVVSVQPLAPVLRHAATFPPLQHPLAGAPGGLQGVDSVPRCLEPVEVLCQLEGTGRWPDAVEPYEKMKAALGVQLAQSLQQGYGMDAQASEDYVDVLTDGFAFRLRLAAERDEAMQKKALVEAGLTLPPPELDIPLRVWQQGVVAAAAAANPAYQPTLRLAKRWVAAHLLSPHLREEVVELLVMAAWAEGAGVAAPAPGSRISGFLRFLLLLANHPWSVQPVVIGITPGEPAALDKKSTANRAHAAAKAAGSVPAMFITGPDPGQCVGWTQDQPSPQMMWRITVLAQRSVKVLEAALNGSDDADQQEGPTLAALFSRDLDEYDAVVRLRPDALPTGPCDLNIPGVEMDGIKTASHSSSKTVDKHCRAILKGIPRSVLQSRGMGAVRKELLVGFHPVSIFVAALQRRFGRVATFCADYVGGAVVGIKWLPSVMKPGPLVPDIAHAQAPSPSGGEEEMVLDVEGVLHDIQVIGAGLVDSIDLVDR